MIRIFEGGLCACAGSHQETLMIATNRAVFAIARSRKTSNTSLAVVNGTVLAV
jgi:hypothetical protein